MGGGPNSTEEGGGHAGWRRARERAYQCTQRVGGAGAARGGGSENGGLEPSGGCQFKSGSSQLASWGAARKLRRRRPSWAAAGHAGGGRQGVDTAGRPGGGACALQRPAAAHAAPVTPRQRTAARRGGRGGGAGHEATHVKRGKNSQEKGASLGRSAKITDVTVPGDAWCWEHAAPGGVGWGDSHQVVPRGQTMSDQIRSDQIKQNPSDLGPQIVQSTRGERWRPHVECARECAPHSLGVRAGA